MEAWLIKQVTPLFIFATSLDEKYQTDSHETFQSHFDKVFTSVKNKEIRLFADLFYALSIPLPKSEIDNFKNLILTLDLPDLAKISEFSNFFTQLALLDPEDKLAAEKYLCHINPTRNPREIRKIAEISFRLGDPNLVVFNDIVDKVLIEKPSQHVIEKFGGDGFAIFTGEDESGRWRSDGNIEIDFEKNEKVDFVKKKEKEEKKVENLKSEKTPKLQSSEEEKKSPKKVTRKSDEINEKHKRRNEIEKMKENEINTLQPQRLQVISKSITAKIEKGWRIENTEEAKIYLQRAREIISSL
ncbi:hypothetical protein EIN_376170 [Entamoeba invadens IP1]|uniref:Uncharacterized protein n=1 Tax=Entamoeba invadens IP1 TaxID=370355 RepID=A0A0A1TU55_ENTIV|nr:hypothetical protein EIN_376170 [Entamoeba invadens IP1]ELP83472.1 hypothetical protein EIN_376170 [Entamoeba invadens IP1]|eukprot:XP_004182818.1 hypothetical protein EIN_376170 [Entamoeba invadens IP1]